MTQYAFPRLTRLPAIGAIAAMAFFAAGPVSAAQGFGPHTGGNEQSNWGGYAASGSDGEFTTITGSWTEPVAKCTKKGQLAAPWIGLDGFGNETVEQTGVAYSCGALAGGGDKYEAWYEMFPNNPHYFTTEKVEAGDTIDASVTNTSGDNYTLVMNDVTQGWTKTIHASLDGAEDASAEAVIEGPGGYPDFPDGVTFTSVMVNGKPLGDYSPTKLTSGGYVPGPLNGEGGYTIAKK
jgi:hypothetical protein